jgi:hypothetical protein
MPVRFNQHTGKFSAYTNKPERKWLGDFNTMEQARAIVHQWYLRKQEQKNAN